MRTTDKPTLAPEDFRARPAERKEDLPWSEVWTGPGRPTEHACAGCGNSEGNLCIYDSWSCGHTGDVVINNEIVCEACGRFSVIVESR